MKNQKDIERFTNKKEEKQETIHGVQGFFRMLCTNIFSMIPMSILYSLMRLTVIPSGLAAVGITEVTGDIARGRHYFGLRDFFGAIKKSWKTALGAGIIDLLVTAILLIAGWFYYSSSGILAAIGFGCFLLTMMITSFMKYYVWPQIVLFKLPLRTVYKNAFLLAFVNIKWNFLIGLISIACYILAVLTLIYVPYTIGLVIVMTVAVCLYPSFKQLLIQYCIFPCIRDRVIEPYYAKHPEQDAEARKVLGL